MMKERLKDQYYFNNKWLNTPVFAETSSTIYIYDNASVNYPDIVEYKLKFYSNFLFLDYHPVVFKHLKLDHDYDCMISPEGEIRSYESRLDLSSFYPVQEGDMWFIKKVYYDKKIKLVDFRERKVYYELEDNMVDSLDQETLSNYINILESCKEKYYYNEVFSKTSDLVFKYKKKQDGFTPGNLLVVKNLPKDLLKDYTHTQLDRSGIFIIDLNKNTVTEKDLKLNLEPFDVVANLDFFKDILKDPYSLSFVDFTNNTFSNTLKDNLVKTLSKEDLDHYTAEYNKPLDLAKDSKWNFFKSFFK